jgi:hypothetical protein
MAQAKKATKRLQLTPDEAMDRMLADHERRAAKKKKQVTPDEAMDLLLAEHDRKAAKKKKATPVEALADVGQQERKKVKREVGPGTVLALEDKKADTSVGALVAKKAKVAPPLPAKKAKLSTSKKQLACQALNAAKSTQREPARRQNNLVEINGSSSV